MDEQQVLKDSEAYDKEYADKVYNMKAGAIQDPRTDLLKCVAPPLGCGQVVFYVEGDEALTRGHVYSPEGRSEYNITGMCEYCFDECMPKEEEEEYDFGPVTDGHENAYQEELDG